jgi:hypothetical protein
LEGVRVIDGKLDRHDRGGKAGIGERAPICNAQICRRSDAGGANFTVGEVACSVLSHGWFRHSGYDASLRPE